MVFQGCSLPPCPFCRSLQYMILMHLHRHGLMHLHRLCVVSQSVQTRPLSEQNQRWTLEDIGWNCLGGGIQYLVPTMIVPTLKVLFPSFPVLLPLFWQEGGGGGYLHYCRNRDFTTRRAPTPPDASYIPDASGPDTLYDTVRRVVHPRRVGPRRLVRHCTTRRTVS